jgi:phosphoglycolate phosphatase
MLISSVTTVLFDLDGTLLDTAPDFAFAVNKVRERRSQEPLTLEFIRPGVSHGMAGLIKLCFDLTVNDKGYNELLEELLHTYSVLNGQYTDYIPGMREVLTHLEDNRLNWGVVTNKHAWLTNPLMQSKELDKKTTCIVSGDTTPYPKPHPEPLWYACKLLKVKPNECLYVGDAQRDIIAGRAAGMKTAAALFGYLGEKDDPMSWDADIYLHSPLDIIPLIQP